MKKLFYLFATIFCLHSFQSEATHIVGGELYYTYLGSNIYQLHLRVYRDCYYGEPPFDQPASIGIFNANNVLVQQVFMFVNDSSTIDPTINSPCFIPPTDVCYRQANYYANVNLPPIPGGYQLSYQRCCRNQTIVNIINPLSTGATFYASIPGSNPNNSNPVYNNLPPPFICAGLPFVFDHSATDADGDSLVYELCTPYDGATQNAPQPQPPFNPPYPNVIFQPPYNLGDLLGGVPMSIDPQTGLLTATPNTIGQFVIGICVNEYRNGVLLSTTRRDYQLNVVPCPTLVVAALQTPILTCGSLSVQFQNNSFGAGSYLWNFGDPTTSGDTTHAVNPSYLYPDTGTYNVTLIAYSSFNPGCADTTVGTVTLLPDFTADFSFVSSPCSFSVAFNDTSNTASGPTSHWNWNFGDGTTDTIADPIHTFPGAGTYTVTLVATSLRGCRKTIVKTVVLLPNLSASATNAGVSCHDSCNAVVTVVPSSGTQPYSYVWDDPLGQTTATATALCPGTYQVTVTDSNNCSATATAIVNNPDVLSAQLTATDAYCNGACIGTATIAATGGTAPYTATWNDPQNQNALTASGLCPGWYTAQLTDNNGCPFSDSVEVIYSTYIPPLDAVISSDTIYDGQTVQLNAITSGGPFTYSWTPAQLVSNPQAANPTATPTGSTTYIVTITDGFGCDNIDSVTVFVKEVICEEPEIFIPNAFTPNGDQNNDQVFVRGNTIKELTFKIFDRWGELVFETNNPKKGWDGTYKGTAAAPAVYVYWLEATCFNNEHFFKKGNITLIR